MVRLQIEKATCSDLTDIARLLEYCVGDSALREAEEYLSNPCALTLKATVDNKIVGFITFLISFENADLIDIAVDERYRRRGIAKSLLEYAQKITNVTTVTLEVRESNTGARQFYRKNGFREISKRKKYYSSPTEDAIIYQKEKIL